MIEILQRRLPRISLLAFLLTVVFVGTLIGFGVSMVQRSREHNHRSTCNNNLLQLALATLNYESACGSLPKGVELGPDGRRWHSWRAVLPPFLEQMHTEYQYKFSQPWDSATNRKLMARLAPSQSPFVCGLDLESCRKNSQVNYLVVLGEGTAFPINRSVKLAEITDGTANTILFVESINTGIQWAEPRDLDFDTMSFEINDPSRPSISSRHAGGANVVFANGAPGFITEAITPAELRALLTIAGGEGVTRDELILRGVIRLD